MSLPKRDQQQEISYSQAIHEALHTRMEQDEKVFVLGQNVDDPKGMFGTTLDLHKEFGEERSFDVPLSEDAITGISIGAAMAGMRPVNVHQRMDFMLLAMNQIINSAAKIHYMYGGEVKVPLVIRGIIGRSWGQGPQHSQALHSLFMHIPGLRVLAPSTPYDAKGLMNSAILDDNPTIFTEHRLLHPLKGIVPTHDYCVPFGQARVLRKGSDITIVAISHMVVEALRASRLMEQCDINVEIIDPVSLVPFDYDTLYESVSKTGHLLVVDCGWLNCGASAEILTQVMLHFQNKQSISCQRVGFAPTPCPTTRVLEDEFYPNARTIAKTALNLLRPGQQVEFSILNEEIHNEVAEFRGPF